MKKQSLISLMVVMVATTSLSTSGLSVPPPVPNKASQEQGPTAPQTPALPPRPVPSSPAERPLPVPPSAPRPLPAPPTHATKPLPKLPAIAQLKAQIEESRKTFEKELEALKAISDEESERLRANGKDAAFLTFLSKVDQAKTYSKEALQKILSQTKQLGEREAGEQYNDVAEMIIRMRLSLEKMKKETSWS